METSSPIIGNSQSVKRVVNWFNNIPGNVTNLAFFVLGIFVTLLFSWFGRDYREISMWYANDPVVVFDSASSSPKLNLLDDSGSVVEGTVFVETVKIWNSGTQPIDNSDVRVPVTFHLSPIARILDYTLLRSTYPDVANFQLTPISSGEENTAIVQLTWDHFDENFGTVVQLMYESEQDADIVVNGHIQGIRPNQFPIVPVTGTPLVTWTLGIASFMCMVPLGIFFRDIRRKRYKVLSIQAFVAICVGGLFGYFGLSLLHGVFVSLNSAPPSGL